MTTEQCPSSAAQAANPPQREPLQTPTRCPRLSRLIFGTMGFSAFLGESRKQRRRLIELALDLGMTSFDTAPLYGFGEGERLLGETLGPRRSNIQFLTKCGLSWESTEGPALFDVEVEGARRTVRLDHRPQALLAELEASLKRLGVECIDLWQLHRPHPMQPLSGTLAVLEEAVQRGKARAVGVCNQPVEQLLRVGPESLGAVQVEYHLLSQRAALPSVHFARARQLPLLAYSPLAQGVLARPFAGRPSDFRAASPLFQPRAEHQVSHLMESTLLPMAADYGVPLAALVLAWLLRQPGVHPIVGASSEAQLRQCAQALAVNLSGEDAATLARAALAVETALNPPGWKQRARRLAGAMGARRLRELGRRWFPR